MQLQQLCIYTEPGRERQNFHQGSREDARATLGQAAMYPPGKLTTAREEQRSGALSHWIPRASTGAPWCRPHTIQRDGARGILNECPLNPRPPGRCRVPCGRFTWALLEGHPKLFPWYSARFLMLAFLLLRPMGSFMVPSFMAPAGVPVMDFCGRNIVRILTPPTRQQCNTFVRISSVLCEPASSRG